MTKFPDHLQCYKKTQTFTAATTPAGLLKNHSLKEGTWGKLHVLEGEVHFTEQNGSTHILVAGTYGMIRPLVVHHIAPSDDAVFYIAFYQNPTT